MDGLYKIARYRRVQDALATCNDPIRAPRTATPSAVDWSTVPTLAEGDLVSVGGGGGGPGPVTHLVV